LGSSRYLITMKTKKIEKDEACDLEQTFLSINDWKNGFLIYLTESMRNQTIRKFPNAFRPE